MQLNLSIAPRPFWHGFLWIRNTFRLFGERFLTMVLAAGWLLICAWLIMIVFTPVLGSMIYSVLTPIIYFGFFEMCQRIRVRMKVNAMHVFIPFVYEQREKLFQLGVVYGLFNALLMYFMMNYVDFTVFDSLTTQNQKIATAWTNLASIDELQKLNLEYRDFLQNWVSQHVSVLSKILGVFCISIVSFVWVSFATMFSGWQNANAFQALWYGLKTMVYNLFGLILLCLILMVMMMVIMTAFSMLVMLVPFVASLMLLVLAFWHAIVLAAIYCAYFDVLNASLEKTVGLTINDDYANEGQ